MEQVKQDIQNALEFIEGKDSKKIFGKYNSPFIFGTENQSGVNRVIDYQDKDVFTVASSADQYLGAVYYGASKIDIFDINRFTYYIANLKIVAIMNLSYEEFLGFFIPSYKKDNFKAFWNLRTLKKLIPSLPSDVAYFWENIMFKLSRKNSGTQEPDYGNFVIKDSKHVYPQNIKRGMPFYESEEEYYKLQAILKRRRLPQFYEADILALKDVIKSKYDILYLSNIIECLVCEEIMKYGSFMPSYGTEDRVEESFIFKICEQVLPLLKTEGIILLDYRPNRSKAESTDLLFNNDYFEATEIPAKFPPYAKEDQVTENDTDLVLTYNPQKVGNILNLIK